MRPHAGRVLVDLALEADRRAEDGGNQHADGEHRLQRQVDLECGRRTLGSDVRLGDQSRRRAERPVRPRVAPASSDRLTSATVAPRAATRSAGARCRLIPKPPPPIDTTGSALIAASTMTGQARLDRTA